MYKTSILFIFWKTMIQRRDICSLLDRIFRNFLFINSRAYDRPHRGPHSHNPWTTRKNFIFIAQTPSKTRDRCLRKVKFDWASFEKDRSSRNVSFLMLFFIFIKPVGLNCGNPSKKKAVKFYFFFNILSFTFIDYFY